MTTLPAALPRLFRFNGMNILDPDPALTPEQAKVRLAEDYPGINNAEMTGPKTESGHAVYTLSRRPETKG